MDFSFIKQIFGQFPRGATPIEFLAIRPVKLLKFVMRLACVLSCLLTVSLFSTAAPSPNDTAMGLILTITSKAGTKSETLTMPAVALYVPEGQSPAVTVPPGAFTATWEGQILGELRSDFAFEVQANGPFQLFINGQSALDVPNATGGASLSKPVQINKGSNAFKAIFHSPAKGDAFVRLSWTEKGTNTTPIPLAAFAHKPSRQLVEDKAFRLGRELFLGHRCARCHQDIKGAVPELGMDAPSFDGIGSRRGFAWMKDWILDPYSQRTNAQMPRIFHGPDAAELATSAAAYLVSLRDDSQPKTASPPKREETADNEAQNLFEALHCGACHTIPGAVEPGKIALDHVGRKFLPGKLVEFLLAPEAHYKWIEMPNFKLSPPEAAQLAEHLLKAAGGVDTNPASPSPGLTEKGKLVVQTSGCLNCHTLKLENKFSAPGLGKLPPERWREGCLAPELSGKTRAPHFQFSAAALDALRQFANDKPGSLRNHVAHEFAARQTKLLNCASCHGQFEGFPALEGLGGKLKPEWAAKFIGGEIPYKPRAEKHPRGEPWLTARMPAFASRANLLAEGMAALHGYPPKSPPGAPADPNLAEMGRKLVGKDGGFSCISCHGVGSEEALEVFESEGINLGYSAERLLPDYYRRWMRNPLAIDPQTKMPMYFEEGRSPLTEVLEGDAEKQISAVWHYLQKGMKMEPPAAAQ